ncbi:MAG: hypothetical protein Q4B63_02220 [Clostridium perfringens]|nr:hypothetical protein [Clostridium perfringens]
MSAPKIERPQNSIDKEQAISDIIESIALEETGLAHIINAEGEKIQRALQISENANDLISVNESVKDTLVNIIKMQMLLQFKLEEVSKIQGDS